MVMLVRAAATGLRGAVRKRLPGFLADRDCVLRRGFASRLQGLGRLNGLLRSATANGLPEQSEWNWSWSDYLIALYIGRRGNTFSVRQDTETKRVKGLVVIAVVVYVASGSRLGVVRQRLLRLRADRDFVLRGC